MGVAKRSELTRRRRPAARSHPGRACQAAPSKAKRAQGMPGEGLTHGPPATRKAGGSYHRCSRSTGIPCAMVLTAASRSPWCAGLVGHHVRRRVKRVAQGISVGMPGPRDLTVRLGAHRLLAPPRPPLPASPFVTIGRNVPLHRGGMRGKIVLICPTRQARKPATEWHDRQLMQNGGAETHIGQPNGKLRSALVVALLVESVRRDKQENGASRFRPHERLAVHR